MKGLIITNRVQEWLQKSHSARILNLFENSCNLVNAHGEVLSLVTAVIGPGPFFIMVDAFNSDHFDLQMPITINKTSQRLVIGRTEIDLRDASLWQAQPEWSKLRSLRVSNLPNPQIFTPDIDDHLAQICTGLVNNNSVTIRDGAFGLAGRGSGLTPTGDDILLGAIYALWVWGPDCDWIRLICDTAVARTTTLSAAFLNAAAAGEATIHWHDFVNGHPNAIQNILKIGHTSGADALTGFTRIAQILHH